MISERGFNHLVFDFMNQDLLSYIPTPLPENLFEDCSDLGSLDRVKLDGQVMYESENATSPDFSVPSCETVKVQKAESNCGSSSAVQGVERLSRQSSLTDEWFGNISNAHPNDISVDSSLEALFAETEWQDFKVEMMTPADASVPENCLAGPSVYETMNCQAAGNIQTKPGDAYTSLPVSATACKTELQAVVPEHVGECSSQSLKAHSENTTNTRRKRRMSSESHESFASDVDSESIEDLTRFAQKFLSDGSQVKPYFWQYNAQSRGPKARRLCSSMAIEDSHVVPDFADPVFCTDLPYQLAHSGKARQGDGNDPRPDPQKLLAIGSHIWRLETQFRSVAADVPSDSVSRRSTNQAKNQLASKICRLKKKALHSANKIKLDGLKQEHDQLMTVIKSIASEVDQCIATGQVGRYSLCQALDQLVRQHLTFMIAGNTGEYVNSELEKVATRLVSGDR